MILKIFAYKNRERYALELVFIFVPKRWKKGQCYNLRRKDPIYNDPKSLESFNRTTGWSHFVWYSCFLPVKAVKICPSVDFYFRPKTFEKDPMLYSTKKGPNWERCQRSQKFASNYWVVLFWVIFMFFARKSRKKYDRVSVFIFVQKCWKKVQCYILRRKDQI